MNRTQRLVKIFPFLAWLPNMTRETLFADFQAGLTGAIIVLPQGVAFAMIAGMPPIYGLYTAMITPIIAGLFGSSKHLISGPTTAISIVVFAAISPYATEGSAEFVSLVLVLTFMAGLIQLTMGLLQLGTLVNFVSHTVVIGFTAGAGLLIAGKQLKYVFGIAVPSGSDFGTILWTIGSKIHETNLYVLAVALTTLLSAIFIRKINRKLPHMLLAMVLGSLTAFLIGSGGDAQGITFVEEMPSSLPPFVIPTFSWENIQKLAPNAFAVALLGLIEAVAIARSIGMSSGQRIDGNQEFIGQGLSNLVGSFFSSYAGSGSFTRSGVNYQAGAVSPLSAIIAAVLLLLIVLFVAPLTAYLPIPAMGGIILLVGYNLIDFHHIRQIFKASRLESTVLVITFFSTLFLELEFAIYVGMIFSLVFYLQRTSKPNVAVMSPDPENHYSFTNIIRKPHLQQCPQLRIVRIDGSLYYGAIDHVQGEISKTCDESYVKNILIIAEGINFVDLAGAEWLTQEAKRRQEAGGNLYVCSLKKISQDILEKGGFKDDIGHDNFFESKNEAIATIYQRLDKNICKTCDKRIFKECNETNNP